MIYYKLYEREWGIMVAACDKDLCNKTLKGKDIEFFINPRFYKEAEADKDKFIEILKGASSVNLVGNDSVECGIAVGLIKKDNIVNITDIPHAQGIVMQI